MGTRTRSSIVKPAAWLLPLLLGFVTPRPVRADAAWVLAKEKEGMRIFTREVAGSGIRELKVESRIRVPAESLAEAYLDVAGHPEWYPACDSARLIRSDGPGRKTIYHRIDNPWPFQDRDYAFTVESDRSGEDGSIVLSYRDVKGLVPQAAGCVRMRKLRGYWKFTPRGDGSTDVTYVFDFDPGGDTPASFINPALTRIGEDTIRGFFRFALSRSQEARHE